MAEATPPVPDPARPPASATPLATIGITPEQPTACLRLPLVHPRAPGLSVAAGPGLVANVASDGSARATSPAQAMFPAGPSADAAGTMR